jgi:hypothetical protein
MRFNIVATRRMMPNRRGGWSRGQALEFHHSGFETGNEGIFAFSLEEIDESDYLYL